MVRIQIADLTAVRGRLSDGGGAACVLVEGSGVQRDGGGDLKRNAQRRRGGRTPKAGLRRSCRARFSSGSGYGVFE